MAKERRELSGLEFIGALAICAVIAYVIIMAITGIGYGFDYNREKDTLIHSDGNYIKDTYNELVSLERRYDSLYEACEKITLKTKQEKK